MRQNRQIWLRFITGIVFFSFLIWFGYFTQKNIKELRTGTFDSDDNVPAVQTDLPDNSSRSTPSSVEIVTPAATTKPASLPINVNIKVPFISQAPFAVWEALHEDACEEASILMIEHMKNGTPTDNKQSVENEITSLVTWEEEKGYGPSITLEDLSMIATKKFGLKGSIKAATTGEIKTELAAGNPVIVGAAGKILPNPNFRNGGPNYHMLVIKGYNSTQFITNDPGTRFGENFVYTYNDLYNAIHNWDSNNILNGSKKYLVFYN